MTTAWLQALTYSVSVRRNTTQVSLSGATKFAYATIATGLACSLQDSGGRMEQDELGQLPARKKTVIADVDFAVVRQNDLLVDEVSGETYKVFHTHFVNNANAPHYEADVEQWVPGGGT